MSTSTSSVDQEVEVVELTPDDFKVINTPRGDVIETILKGISLVLFYNPDCEYSNAFLPLLDQMNNTIGCLFGKFNIVKYQTHTALTLKTKTPLTYTPYIVLYVNGKPYMSYNGPPDEVEIKKLIMYIQLMQTITASMCFNENTVIPIYKI